MINSVFTHSVLIVWLGRYMAECLISWWVVCGVYVCLYFLACPKSQHCSFCLQKNINNKNENIEYVILKNWTAEVTSKISTFTFCFVCMWHVYMCVQTCQIKHEEVRRHLVDMSSLHLPCGPSDSNSDPQSWKQATLSGEPYHYPGNYFLMHRKPFTTWPIEKNKNRTEKLNLKILAKIKRCISLVKVKV